MEFNFNHNQGPQADFSQGPDLYQRCQEWKEECELLLNGPLAGKDNAIKASYVRLWAGKTGRTHIKSLNLKEEELAKLMVLLQRLVDWTKPRSNELAAAAKFRELQQGTLSLAEYIDKATVLCDQCNYHKEARDRLLHDAIVIGLRSRDAYFKCIEKGSSLTLEEAISIAESAEATESQVGYMRPEFKVTTKETVNKIQKKGRIEHKGQPSKPSFQKDSGQRPTKGSCSRCGNESHPVRECPAKNATCFKCNKKGHYGNRCRTSSAKVHEVQATEDSEQYQSVFFGADVKTITTATVKSLNNPQHKPHIRPLWISNEESAPVHQIECEVDTGADCNILPLYKAKALFGDKLKMQPA